MLRRYRRYMAGELQRAGRQRHGAVQHLHLSEQGPSGCPPYPIHPYTIRMALQLTCRLAAVGSWWKVRAVRGPTGHVGTRGARQRPHSLPRMINSFLVHGPVCVVEGWGESGESGSGARHYVPVAPVIHNIYGSYDTTAYRYTTCSRRACKSSIRTLTSQLSRDCTCISLIVNQATLLISRIQYGRN